jgi:hypothetical protein
MRRFLQFAVHPTPEPDRTDTSLRYTDILFGFAIRELFLRLQHWPEWSVSARLQLITGTALVLGSWIGYRRSVNRAAYQVKFFNLPLFRFLIDQMMLILYFRVATLNDPGNVELPADALVRTTTLLIVVVFVLYVFWDLLGIWTATAKNPATGKPRYTKVEFDPATGKPAVTATPQTVDWPGFWITFWFFVAFVTLWQIAGCYRPEAVFIIATALLVLYRWVKEIRTTWRSQTPPAAA